MRNSTTYLLALFIVFSALLGGGAPRPTVPGGSPLPEQPKQPSAEPFQFSPCVVDADIDPVSQCSKCPLFCPAKGLLDTLQSTAGGSGDLNRWNTKPELAEETTFVIATVPDPVHSHLSLVFDRNIDAIQKAAQASGQGYLFERAWMPWEDETSAESTDFRLREQQKLLEDKKEDLPGILIFRREPCTVPADGSQASNKDCTEEDQKQKFLFVLVVGETPTGGVHSAQFQNAMKILRAIRATPGTAAQKPDGVLRILGTTFSGSLDSLFTLLKSSNVQEFDRIEVQSGTTTDLKSILRFREQLKSLKASVPGGPPKTRFVALQENGDYSYDRLLNYLRNMHFQEDEIALLSEDETAYGRIKTGGDTVPKFYFPRDIAQLRASYQRELNGKPQDGGNKQAPRSALPLNLDVTGSDDDSVHSFSKLQTPLSQEAVLKGIVANLQKHHTKFVIVRATNVLDSLFLCQYLRGAYPDGGLIVFGSDLLFQQDPDDGKLRGVLSVTTYPLLPGVDDGSEAATEHADQVFPDSNSAGVYNATVSLLSTKIGSTSDTLETPANGGNYASYGWPSLGSGVKLSALPQKPALWLTQMGKGGYWPIVLLDDPQMQGVASRSNPELLVRAGSSGSNQKSDEESKHWMGVSFGLSWKILWWITFVVLGIYVWGMLCPQVLPRSELGVVFSLPGQPIRNGCLFGAGLILLGLLACFLFPWIHGGWRNRDIAWLVLPALSLVGVGFAGYRGLDYRGNARLGRMFAWASLAMAGVFILTGAAGRCHPIVSGRIFFVRLFTHLESGLSPVGPIYFLLAGFLWCLWFALDGIQFSDADLKLLPPESLFKNTDLDVLQKQRLMALSNEAQGGLLDVMLPLCRNTWAYVPGIFVMGALVAILGTSLPIVSLENKWYRFLISLLLGCGLFLLVSLFTRLVMIWLDCKLFLQRMESLKLRRSFHFGDDFEWGTLWRLVSNAGVLKVYQQVSRELECLEDFQKYRDEFHGKGLDLERKVKEREKIEKAYEEASGAVEKTQGDFSATIQFFLENLSSKKRTTKIVDCVCASSKMRNLTNTFHNSMSVAFGKILVLLSLEWEQEPPSGNGSAENGAEEKDEDDKKGTKKLVPPKRPGLACAERCACLYLLTVALIPLRKIRSLVFGISGLYVFLLLGLTSFHFEPHLTIQTAMIVLFLCAMGCIGYVYSQIYRNKTLSRITATPEASLGWDFWARMAGFVAVPVLSLLAAQFPELNHFLFSWLQPALQSFH